MLYALFVENWPLWAAVLVFVAVFVALFRRVGRADAELRQRWDEGLDERRLSVESSGVSRRTERRNGSEASRTLRGN